MKLFDGKIFTPDGNIDFTVTDGGGGEDGLLFILLFAIFVPPLPYYFGLKTILGNSALSNIFLVSILASLIINLLIFFLTKNILRNYLLLAGVIIITALSHYVVLESYSDLYILPPILHSISVAFFLANKLSIYSRVSFVSKVWISYKISITSYTLILLCLFGYELISVSLVGGFPEITLLLIIQVIGGAILLGIWHFVISIIPILIGSFITHALYHSN